MCRCVCGVGGVSISSPHTVCILTSEALQLLQPKFIDFCREVFFPGIKLDHPDTIQDFIHHLQHYNKDTLLLAEFCYAPGVTIIHSLHGTTYKHLKC